MKIKPSSTKLHFKNTLPTRNQFSPCAVLIYDSKLEKRFSRWIKLFPHRIKVSGGENLKSLSIFEQLADKVQKISTGYPKSEISIVSFGGGSVGDVCGFLAATFKRGVSLVHVPSTWLAAIDSSHGGKNALNLKGSKNQIGCFYFAKEIFIIKEVLEFQPPKLLQDAFGEVAKIGLLDLKAKKKFEKKSLDDLWALIPEAIAAKMRVVKQDPLETKGKRQALNLGHSMGHVLEAQMGISHGQAVAQGLIFTVELSQSLGLLNSKKKDLIKNYLKENFKIKNNFKKPFLKFAHVNKLLLQDKKNTQNGIATFVLLKDFGKPVLKNVPLKEVYSTLEVLKWLK